MSSCHSVKWVCSFIAQGKWRYDILYCTYIHVFIFLPSYYESYMENMAFLVGGK
uniref:Uncharacterized protein n=1 Tax=Anguilla anguilla TaxID=7936 RepID=A0A0E9TW43_ANGAN